MVRAVHRVRNALIRRLRGLPPASRAVAPEVDDDVFQAHLAVYRFCAGFAAEARCLDLGCGTGYGAAELARYGAAAEVVGIDPDQGSIAYARRRFGGAARFEVGRAEDLREDPGRDDLGTFALVVACNVLPQLADAGAVLARIPPRLEADGVFIASVPPILDGQAMELHRARNPGGSNLYLWEWEDLLRTSFSGLRLFRQMPPAGLTPHFTDPGPARVKARAYAFEELPLEDLYDAGSLTAIFVCSEPVADRA